MNPVMAAPASLPVQAGLFSFPHPAVNHCHSTYSRRIDQMMFWKKDDQEDYLKAIKKILLRFFDDAEGGAT